MKTIHKWSKEISEITFFFKDSGSFGEVVWRKRTELVLKKGAILSTTPETKKDGTINFSAMVAETLRNSHQQSIQENKTIEDIVFNSPNQLGLFLRYGGENSWLSLKDDNGKTLEDWSKVE